MFCIHAPTLSQSKFGIQSSNMTREVTVRHHFNWIILTAPGAPCGCYEIQSDVVVLPFDVMFGYTCTCRSGHILLVHLFFFSSR